MKGKLNMYGQLLNYPIEDYRKMKIEILKYFTVPITDEIEKEINRRNSESEIDRYCHDVIKCHLGCE